MPMISPVLVEAAVERAAALLTFPRFTVTLIEERDKHFYTVNDGARLPGVTGILQVINKPALIPWAKKEALKVVEAEIITLLNGKASAKIPVDKDWLEALVKKAKARPDKIKTDAGDLGTRAHAWVDAWIKNTLSEGTVFPEVTDDIKFATWNFLNFVEQENMTFIAGDTKIASRKHGFGGSLDWLAIDRNGKLVLGDIKTSNGIWPEYGAQLGGYAIALEETYGLKADRGVIIRLGKETAEYEQGEIDNMDRARCAFIDAKNLKETIEDKFFIKKTKENQPMPDTSTLSKYLKPEHVNDGDTITFLDAGVILEKTFKKEGADDKKPALEITVKFKGENKIYSPNGTTVKLLNAAWGTATEKWVGKEAILHILPASNGKNMIVGKPKV